MSSRHEDAQFIAISILATCFLARLIAAMLGWLPWSWWIIVTVFCVLWAFLAWAPLEDETT